MQSESKSSNILKVTAVFATVFCCVFTAITLKYLLVRHYGADRGYIYAGACIASTVCLIAAGMYFANSRKRLVSNIKELAAVSSAITVGFIVNLYLALLSVYLMPVALSAFIIAPLSRRHDAFVGNLMSNILTAAILMTEAVATGGEIEPIVVMLVAGIGGGSLISYNVSNDTKRLNYIIKGLVIGVSTAALVVAYLAARRAALQWATIYLAIGVASQLLLGLMLQPIFEAAFNLVTNSRLVELTDRNAPLMKRLSNEAPGTFSHSLAVANFAELCAVAIGENPYLARACAYYHDVGKLTNTEYFKENQSDYNPHDELLPEVSAEIIRSHTDEGLALCNRYRIPHEISHVTVQHHGTLLIPVFYEKAKGLTDGAVDQTEYSYHGITPRTKVAAIIMICDSGEAAIRAMDKPDGARVDKLIKGLIDSRIAAGQFDECDISLKDLTTIRRTIVSAYGGVFHKRLKYPKGN